MDKISYALSIFLKLLAKYRVRLPLIAIASFVKKTVSSNKEFQHFPMANIKNCHCISFDFMKISLFEKKMLNVEWSKYQFLMNNTTHCN